MIVPSTFLLVGIMLVVWVCYPQQAGAGAAGCAQWTSLPVPGAHLSVANAASCLVLPAPCCLPQSACPLGNHGALPFLPLALCRYTARAATALTLACTSAAGSSGDPQVRGRCGGDGHGAPLLPGALGKRLQPWLDRRHAWCTAHVLTHPHATHARCLPAGIIGTNLVDAEQTVDTMVSTQETFRPVEAEQPGAEGLRPLLEGRGVQVGRRGGKGLARLGLGGSAPLYAPHKRIPCFALPLPHTFIMQL